MSEENKGKVTEYTPYIDQFDPAKKKKKKKKPWDSIDDSADNLVEKAEHLASEGEEGIIRYGYLSEANHRDYDYKELLARVFDALRENNLEASGERQRTMMLAPQFLGEGTQKTVCVNFTGICRTMHRKPENVMGFLMAEMGTKGTLDGHQRLVLKGRFAPKEFEGSLRRYIDEYVICNCCKCPDTTLTEENRLFYLKCELCGSKRAIAPIKTGFRLG